MKLMSGDISMLTITHLEHHNLLSDLQHGFRRKRSTENQLILTVQDLAADLDKGQQIDAVLLDFSKAFDEVPHRRLLLKLHHPGVRSNTLSWMDCRLYLRSLPGSSPRR
jgi:hypothetical protein